MNESEELEIYRASIESLKDLLKTQCSDGNWNYDPYMHGMANGMILALSVFTDEQPVFLDAPDEWITDKASAKLNGTAIEHPSKAK